MSGSEQNPGNEPPTIGTGPGQVPADGLPPSGRSTLRIVRQNLFGSAKKTLDFIDNAENDKTVKVRVDDQRSYLFLISGVVLLAIDGAVLLFVPAMNQLCMGIGVIADLLLGAAVLWYVALRFGVIRTLDPRYAVIVFQLLIGTGILFTFLTINAAILFVSLVSKAQ